MGGSLYMINIFIGLFFVFFKTNLSFVDIGVTYYVTNLIGYILIFAGIKELGMRNKKFEKVKHYTVFMIFHSFLFILLNVTENSPVTMALSTGSRTAISFLGFGFIIAGMFMVFYIIDLLIEGFKNELSGEFTLKKLDYISRVMVLTFILATISFMFNFVPMLAEALIGVLLLLKISFLFFYDNLLLKKNRKLI